MCHSVPVEVKGGFQELNSGCQACTLICCSLNHLAGQGAQLPEDPDSNSFAWMLRCGTTGLYVMWLKDESSCVNSLAPSW